VVTLVVTVGTIGVGQARAENLVLPNWPQLLPANPYTPSGTDPLGWDVCKTRSRHRAAASTAARAR